jgi:hypothetical protein
VAQWSEQKKSTWTMIEAQLGILEGIGDRIRGVGSGEIPAPEHFDAEQVRVWIREESAKLRQKLFKESIALVSLQQHFHAIE